MIFILLLLLMSMSIELDAFRRMHADEDLFINTLVPPATRNPQAVWDRIISRLDPLYRDFLFPDWRIRVSPQYLENAELRSEPMPANAASDLAARLAQAVANLNAGVNQPAVLATPSPVRNRPVEQRRLLQGNVGRLARAERRPQNSPFIDLRRAGLQRLREEEAEGQPPRNRRRIARQLFGDEVIYDIGRGDNDRRDPDDGGVPVS